MIAILPVVPIFAMSALALAAPAASLSVAMSDWWYFLPAAETAESMITPIIRPTKMPAQVAQKIKPRIKRRFIQRGSRK